ncbi:protein of unknown function DUF265 [Pyrobaculum islandicum DSM 4184]|uniref:Nucleoside-triphosphatase THEP1 n=1 Tax=Pyrobaculum islandicum (strain DSM 4184 / JCM 9189 / GEO3) TaxID=384616 RepID=NTPTH_PYRIL|nr:NTPase [Pyrobaculum islandicum]A1RRZ4.1 RecName: Full=Nucleoside-triphosphatase THEP1; Short=NTPase THEP1; AltName: Full=Nucleoside triphosphate phosphohydrolase [Pyrobaculum islandicum DSM 4184]ABL87726.1 protein of unknown function DUF265 [Pyrobaculum islandicum DSM 4184]
MTLRERAELKLGISGMPGVGKTTLVTKVLEVAKSKFAICGFITVEVRDGGKRIGFDIIDVNSGERKPFAREGIGMPSVGKYVINLGTCTLISKALRHKPCNLAIVDEIGAMEFKCPNFTTDLEEVVSNTPRILATIHRNYIGIAKRLGFEVIWLTRENWEMTYKQVLKRLGLSI